MAKDIEISFPIGLLWPVEQANLLIREMLLSCFIKVEGKEIRASDARSGVSTLSSSIVPSPITSSDIDVN